MPPNVVSERRRRRRAYLPIAASLFTEDAKVGEYLIRDISAGGALFTHGPAIPRGRSFGRYWSVEASGDFRFVALSRFRRSWYQADLSQPQGEVWKVSDAFFEAC
jgi:hypothetical protein